jgi:hypothetical protein
MTDIERMMKVEADLIGKWHGVRIPSEDLLYSRLAPGWDDSNGLIIFLYKGNHVVSVGEEWNPHIVSPQQALEILIRFEERLDMHKLHTV